MNTPLKEDVEIDYISASVTNHWGLLLFTTSECFHRGYPLNLHWKMTFFGAVPNHFVFGNNETVNESRLLKDDNIL